MKLMAFLESRIFRPLGMQSPIDLDTHPLTSSDPRGLHPLRLGTASPTGNGRSAGDGCTRRVS